MTRRLPLVAVVVTAVVVALTGPAAAADGRVGRAWTSPAAAERAATPQPSPAPVANGWQLVHREDFTNGTSDMVWPPYDEGVANGSACGFWEADMVSVSGGKLNLTQDQAGGETFAAGVAMGPGQLYGKWVVRFRIPAKAEMGYALLLWPDSEVWPDDGELDFAEDAGGDRQGTTATTHWGADNQTHQEHLDADFTQWQEIGVEWSPGQIAYTHNGRAWSVQTQGVPTSSMHLALQTGPSDCTAGQTPATLQVDWVAVYSLAGAAAAGAQ